MKSKNKNRSPNRTAVCVVTLFIKVQEIYSISDVHIATNRSYLAEVYLFINLNFLRIPDPYNGQMVPMGEVKTVRYPQFE